MIPIRPLDPGDPEIASGIHGVMQAAYRIEAELLGVADFVPLHRTVTQLVTSASRFWGAFVDQSLAAVVEIELHPADTPHIASLVVLPESFRRGLGSGLLRHVIDRHGGERGLTVSTGVLNRPAILLYASQGFEEHRRWTTPDGISMITLRRPPSSAGEDSQE